MEGTVLIFLNCAASVASIGSFVYCLQEMARTTEPPARDGRRRSLKYEVAFIALSTLTTFLALSLKYNIQTIEQSGSFKQCKLGENTIFYAIPYERTPNLTIICQRDDISSPPEVREQHPDRFVVNLQDSLARNLYSWKSSGVKPRNVK